MYMKEFLFLFLCSLFLYCSVSNNDKKNIKLETFNNNEYFFLFDSIKKEGLCIKEENEILL